MTDPHADPTTDSGSTLTTPTHEDRRHDRAPNPPLDPERAYARPVGGRRDDEGVATIFERNGGFAVIRKVVSAFYDRVLASPDLGRHFVDVDMRGLINHQTQFISFVMGGPGTSYTDDALLRVHAPLHISAAEFEEMRMLLRETLEDHGFSDEDVQSVDAAVDARRSAVVADR